MAPGPSGASSGSGGPAARGLGRTLSKRIKRAVGIPPKVERAAGAAAAGGGAGAAAEGAGAGRDGGGGQVGGSRTAESSQAAAEPAPASAATAGSEEGQRLPEPRLHRVGRALLVLAAAYWALSSGAGGKVALEDLEPRNFRAKPKNPPSRHLVWLSQVGFGFGLGFFLFLGGGG